MIKKPEPVKKIEVIDKRSNKIYKMDETECINMVKTGCIRPIELKIPGHNINGVIIGTDNSTLILYKKDNRRLNK